jgi:hypothetical protein
MDLLLVRFGSLARSPGERWALTPPLHPYLIHVLAHEAIGGCSLFHCLSGHPARSLTGTLSYGARTFLPPSCRPAGDHLDHSAEVEGLEPSRSGFGGRAIP